MNETQRAARERMRQEHEMQRDVLRLSQPPMTETQRQAHLAARKIKTIRVGAKRPHWLEQAVIWVVGGWVMIEALNRLGFGR